MPNCLSHSGTPIIGHFLGWISFSSVTPIHPAVDATASTHALKLKPKVEIREVYTHGSYESRSDKVCYDTLRRGSAFLAIHVVLWILWLFFFSFTYFLCFHRIRIWMQIDFGRFYQCHIEEPRYLWFQNSYTLMFYSYLVEAD